MDPIPLLGFLSSLLALLLTHDVVAGEREGGTLQVVLSHALARWELLLGEYIGGAVSVGLPLAACLLGLLFGYGAEPALGLTIENVVVLLGVFVLLGLLVSCFLLTGLLISCRIRGSGATLLAGVLVWCGAVVVYPNLAAGAAIWLRPVAKTSEISSSGVLGRTSGDPEQSLRGRDDDAGRILRERLEQARVERCFSLALPYSSYIAGSDALTGEDVAAHAAFLARMNLADRALMAWQQKMVKQYPDRERAFVYGEGPLDLEGLPEAEEMTEALDGRIGRAIPPLLTLLLVNGVLGGLASLALRRYDPRPR